MLEGIAQYVDVNLKMTLAHYNAYAAQTCYARTFGNEREVYWCCGRSVSVILSRREESTAVMHSSLKQRRHI